MKFIVALVLLVTCTAVLGDHEETPFDTVRIDEECEAGVNEISQAQIATAFKLTAMSIYLRRYNVDMPGFSMLFAYLAHKKVLQATEFQEYLLNRGGRIEWKNIPAPNMMQHAGNPVALIAQRMQEEIGVYEKMQALYEKASEHGDNSLRHYLDKHILQPQLDGITRMKKVLTGLSAGNVPEKLMLANIVLVRKMRPLLKCDN